MRFAAALFVFSLTALAADNAQDLVEGGHYKRAYTVLDARLKANPNDAQANYLMSRVKMVTNDHDAALKFAEKAVAADGKSAVYHYQLSQVIGSIAEKASMLKQFGYARRYKSEVETATALDPKNIDARIAMLEYYLEAPGIMGGDKKKAEAIAEEISRMDACRGYLATAMIVQKEKDHAAKQEDLYKKAAAADPKHYVVRILLANIYLNPPLKNLELAEKHARDAQKLEPDRSAPYSLLAIRYAMEQRVTELEAVLAEAEKTVTDNLSPYFQAARILIDQGKELPRAERYLRKYLTQDPEPNQPSHARTHWRLGQALEKQGRKPEAIAEVETAVRMEPKFEPATKDLKRLKG